MTSRHLNILLLGKNGQVGWELHHFLSPLGRVHALDRQQLDLNQPDDIRKTVRAVSPDVIVNAAAYTAVEKAEAEPEAARAVNGTAPLILAEEALRLKALLIHYSTDYVFDGSKQDPYTEEDTPNPLNIYGATKREGEQGIISAGGRYLILRTSWVYGIRGNNFLRTMFRLAKGPEEIRVVNDQRGIPTWCGDIAQATTLLLSANHSGIYHLASQGDATWYEFASKILEGRRKVTPITTDLYPSKLRRPRNSCLSSRKIFKTFGIQLPPWELSLANVLKIWNET